MKKIILILSTLINMNLACAGLAVNVVMDGRVDSFDSKTVYLIQNGKKFAVARSKFPAYQKLRAGKNAYAVTSSDEIQSAIKKQIKKTK